jgi:hypothetical protein
LDILHELIVVDTEESIVQATYTDADSIVVKVNGGSEFTVTVKKTI